MKSGLTVNLNSRIRDCNLEQKKRSKNKVGKQNSNVSFGAPIKSIKLYSTEAKNFNTIDLTHDIFKKFTDVAPKLCKIVKNFFNSIDTNNRTFMDAFDELPENIKDEFRINIPYRSNSYMVPDLGVIIEKLGKNSIDLSDNFVKNEENTVFCHISKDIKEPVTVFVAEEGAKVHIESQDEDYCSDYFVTTYRKGAALPAIARTLDDLKIEKKIVSIPCVVDGELKVINMPEMNFYKIIDM